MSLIAGSSAAASITLMVIVAPFLFAFLPAVSLTFFMVMAFGEDFTRFFFQGLGILFKIAIVYVEACCAMTLISRVDWKSFDFCDLTMNNTPELIICWILVDRIRNEMSRNDIIQNSNGIRAYNYY